MSNTNLSAIQLIYGEENIGDSLNKINNNFTLIKETACDLEQQIDNKVNVRTFFYYGPNAATNPDSGMNSGNLTVPSTTTIQNFVNGVSGLDLPSYSEEGDIVYVVYQKTGWYAGVNNYVRSGSGSIPYQVSVTRTETVAREESYFITETIPVEDESEIPEDGIIRQQTEVILLRQITTAIDGSEVSLGDLSQGSYTLEYVGGAWTEDEKITITDLGDSNPSINDTYTDIGNLPAGDYVVEYGGGAWSNDLVNNPPSYYWGGFQLRKGTIGLSTPVANLGDGALYSEENVENAGISSPNSQVGFTHTGGGLFWQFPQVSLDNYPHPNGTPVFTIYSVTRQLKNDPPKYQWGGFEVVSGNQILSLGDGGLYDEASVVAAGINSDAGVLEFYHNGGPAKIRLPIKLGGDSFPRQAHTSGTPTFKLFKTLVYRAGDLLPPE